MLQLNCEQIWHRHYTHGGTEEWGQIARSLGVSSEGMRSAVRRWAKDNVPSVVVAEAGAHFAGHETMPSLAPVFATPHPDDMTLEEFVALTRLTQKAVDSVDPQPTHEIIRLPGDKPCAILFASCMHLGSRYVNHAAFEAMLKDVLKVDRLYWLMLGDDVEGMAGFFDVAAASEQAIADPRVQRAMLARVLDKLVDAGKLLAGFAGQHGADWQRRKSGEDPIKTMYTGRKIPYFDGQAFIRLEIGEQVYRLFGSHQLPGHSMYNQNHAQKRAALFKAPSADVIFMGDKHVTAVQRITLDTWEYLAGERPSPQQILLQVGTQKTGPDHYTVKTWSPAFWDWPILVFRHDRHEIVEAGNVKLAQMMLKNDW